MKVNNWTVSKVFGDDSTTDKPYGVETVFQGKKYAQTIWFATQEEQLREYRQCIKEISKGEWL